MKIELKSKYVLQGWSKMHGIHHSRIKARSRKVNTSWIAGVVNNIKGKYDSYTSEYRLVKEEQGYIFREVLSDSGMSGHHKTIKRAVHSALAYTDIFIDEPFEHSDLQRFKMIYEKHIRREMCKHKAKYFNSTIGMGKCPDCDTVWIADLE